MTQKLKADKRAAGIARARLTNDERERIQQRAKACGVTVSKWVRDTLMEALDTSPSERRLTAFIAAQTVAIRIAMEEWQKGKDLTKVEVRDRIERLALETSAAFTRQAKTKGETA